MLSHGGVSGSPAFVPYETQNKKQQLALIGLVSQHFELPANVVNLYEERVAELQVNQNSGIVAVIPGCDIIRTIDLCLS